MVLRRNRVVLAIAFALAFALLVLLVRAQRGEAVATSFTGGADQYPRYFVNDHTPAAVHFTASGLTPNHSYYVKMRYTVATTPSGGTNRGWTWNPATGLWAQERTSWTNFPQVTTNASGEITGTAGRAYTKFGDETVSGTWHLLVSLSMTGESSTFNASVAPTITVLSAAAAGSHVHNAFATSAGSGADAVVTQDTSSGVVFGATKTEANLLDDDADGAADNEGHGSAGSSGDFRLGVPASTSLDVYLNDALWVPSDNFTSGPADVDVAIGAADHMAPAAPTGLTATATAANVGLAWSASADNPGGSGIAGYYVYRWQDILSGSQWTAPHTRIATVTAGTTYVDNAVTSGQTYRYEVRAFDLSTNVSARSNNVEASPDGTPPSPVTDLAASSASTSSALMSWTAPGDDGDFGTATAYDVRYSKTPITNANFGAATPAAGVPAPQPGGSVETYRLSGLTSAYYVALKSRDDAGNSSTLSNVAVAAPDTQAPVSSISVPSICSAASKDTTFTVSWSAVDPAPSSGLASYDVQYKVGVSGAWRALRTATALKSSKIRGTKGMTYYCQARARDKAGRVGAWTAAKSTMVPYDQTQATRSGVWSTVSSPNSYFGSVGYTTRSGASMTLTSRGQTAYLIATVGPACSKAAVYVNGRYVRTINTYSATTAYRRAIYLGTFTGYTTNRTWKLVNMPATGRTRLIVDGFALLR